MKKSKFSLSKWLEDNKPTPEEEDAREKRRVEYLKTLTPSYQLGVLIGDDMANTQLPMLSCDMERGRNKINLNEEDDTEHSRLSRSHSVSYRENQRNPSPELKKESEEKWKLYQDFRQHLKIKYLPEEVRCFRRDLHLGTLNQKEFKDGLRSGLWNSDICAYNLEPESIVFEETKYATYIILKRD